MTYCLILVFLLNDGLRVKHDIQYIIWYKTGWHQESVWGESLNTQHLLSEKSGADSVRGKQRFTQQVPFQIWLNTQPNYGRLYNMEVFTWLTWVAFLFIPCAYTAQWQQNQNANHDPYSICPTELIEFHGGWGPNCPIHLSLYRNRNKLYKFACLSKMFIGHYRHWVHIKFASALH